MLTTISNYTLLKKTGYLELLFVIVPDECLAIFAICIHTSSVHFKFNKKFSLLSKYGRHSTKAFKSIDSTRTLGTIPFTITQ